MNTVWARLALAAFTLLASLGCASGRCGTQAEKALASVSHVSSGPAPVSSRRVLTASGGLRYERMDRKVLCSPAGSGEERLQVMLRDADVQVALQALAAEHGENVCCDRERISIATDAATASMPMDQVPPALRRFLEAVDRVCSARFGRRYDDPLFVRE